MIVGSIKEDLASEKRVSVTPETAKNIINLGLISDIFFRARILDFIGFL